MQHGRLAHDYDTVVVSGNLFERTYLPKPLQLAPYAFMLHLRRYFFLSPLPATPLRERWQPKWIAAILGSEDTEQKAVHDKDNATPHQDCNLLNFRIRDTWDFQCQ